MNIAKIISAFHYLRANGIAEFIARLRYGQKRNISDDYRFVCLNDLPRHPDTDKVMPNSINWFISGFSATSGGHINIIRFVQKLEAQGFDCRIVITCGEWMMDPVRVQADMVAAFGPMRAKVFLGMAAVEPAYACIATGYDTAYYVKAFASTVKKFYFVQDFEPWFNGHGSQHVFAETTYGFGLIGITAGQWLADKLASDYGMETYSFGFSYDAKLYKNGARTVSNKKRVFFYARPETERRAFALGVLVLNELCRRHKDVEVVFAGGQLPRWEFTFSHQVMGVLKVNQLGALYNSCDVALVLSMTNVSLLPMELMACGTPVVSNTGPWIEWLLTPENSKLAAPRVSELVDALEEVLYSSAEWQRLHLAGLAVALNSSWDAEAQRVVAALAAHGCHAT